MPNNLYHLNLKPIGTSSPETDTAQPNADSALIASLRTTWETWHKRLGHLSYHTMRKMVQQGLVTGLKGDGECKIPDCLCDTCQLAKFHKLPFIKKPKRPTSRIGELVCSDSWGPVSEESLSGARHFISFKDDFSGSLHVFFMKKKSEGPAYIRQYANLLLNQTGNYILTLRTDNAKGEYINQENKKWCEDRGIRHETCAPYTPEQNGTAERTNRTLLNHARAMLISSGLPHSFWAEAVAYSAYIRNRCLSKSNPVTAYENWFGHKPDLSNCRIFGVEAFSINPMAGKLDPQSQRGIFVGICETQKAFRIYIPEKKRIAVSRHVTFNETVYFKDMVFSSPPFQENTSTLDELFIGIRLRPLSIANDNGSPPTERDRGGEQPSINDIPSSPEGSQHLEHNDALDINCNADQQIDNLQGI